MSTTTRAVFVAVVLLLLSTRAGAPGVFAPVVFAEDAKAAAPTPPDSAAARTKGLEWLAKNANPDGSWGKSYTVAVTGLACLAQLASSDDPFAGDGAGPLTKGIAWLLATQKDGVFPQQGHTWIHGQGFATLALAEGYGRALLGTTKPNLDMVKGKRAVAAAAKTIVEAQSTSGGWWYTIGSPGQHEGSTTVCAVQALVAASNYGIRIDAAVLEKGFEYLKRCQNPDGGFDYQEGPGDVSMKEGTAGDVATLALMKKFDYDVMTKGAAFLKKIGPAAITVERFPYYGHFYACMGLRLFGEEMDAMPQADAWMADASKEILAWQQADGSWPLKGWMLSNGESSAYSTAFATLVLSVPAARLSVFRRTPPTLPTEPLAPSDPKSPPPSKPG